MKFLIAATVLLSSLAVQAQIASLACNNSYFGYFSAHAYTQTVEMQIGATGYATSLPMSANHDYVNISLPAHQCEASQLAAGALSCQVDAATLVFVNSKNMVTPKYISANEVNLDIKEVGTGWNAYQHLKLTYLADGKEQTYQQSYQSFYNGSDFQLYLCGRVVKQ